MFNRHLEPEVLAALADTPAVFLHGPRQCGKTTLARHLAASAFTAGYASFDDRSVLAAAKSDPGGFVAGLETPVVLDEVQRVPELMVEIKAEIDRDRRPGRFLLTGSAHAMALPELAAELLGRAQVLALRPLSQGEIEGRRDGLGLALFSAAPRLAGLGGEDAARTWQRVMAGGFPEPVQRQIPARREAWFESYVEMILQREVRELAQIEDFAGLDRLLSTLATRSAQQLNFAELLRTTGIPQTTLKRYVAVLEATFLVERLPAWSNNLGKRLTKSPKVFVADTGLLGHLLGHTIGQSSRARPELAGPLLESFVTQELGRQATWAPGHHRLYHFRTHEGHEVDVVLEDRAGRVVAVEVKAAATVAAEDFRGLKLLAAALGERFVRGVVLYLGRETVPFAANLHALPLPALWQLGAPAA